MKTNNTERSKPQKYTYGSTQVNLPSPLAREIKAFARQHIATAVLVEDGYETNIHITVKYGIKTARPLAALKAAFAPLGPITATLGAVAVFEGSPDYDVLHIEVVSADLSKANQAVKAAVDCDDTHPVYKPHVTLAYVEKGKGFDLAGSTAFQGRAVSFDTVVVSAKGGRKTAIALAGEKVSKALAHTGSPYADHTEMVPISEVKKFREYDRSARPRDGQLEFNALKENIRQHGIKEPLMLDYQHDKKIATLGEGNHRLAAADELGHTHVPVRVARSYSVEHRPHAKVSGFDMKPRIVNGQEYPAHLPGSMKPSEIGVGVSAKKGIGRLAFVLRKGVDTEARDAKGRWTSGNTGVGTKDVHSPSDVRCTNAVLGAFGIDLGAKALSEQSVTQAFKDNGFKTRSVDFYNPETWKNDCPTVRQFANEHPKGDWYISTSGHGMCLRDGNLTDTAKRGFDGRRLVSAYEVTKVKDFKPSRPPDAEIADDAITQLRGIREKCVAGADIEEIQKLLNPVYHSLVRVVRFYPAAWAFTGAEIGDVAKKKQQITRAVSILLKLGREKGVHKGVDTEARDADGKWTTGGASQTDSPAFKAWFGGSKVVDDQGKPRVAYHGSRHGFDAFDTSSALGSHFGTVEQASHFVRSESTGDRIYPVYLSIQNPLRLTDNAWEVPEKLKDSLERAGVLTGWDEHMASESEKQYNAAMLGDGIPQWRQDQIGKHYPKTSPDPAAAKNHLRQFYDTVKSAMQKHGYDGIVYANENEGAGDSYIAFHPHQIKSAIGNSGAFSPHDQDITKGIGRLAFVLRKGVDTEARDAGGKWTTGGASQTASPAFKAWFGDSKVVDADGKPLVVYHGTKKAGFDTFQAHQSQDVYRSGEDELPVANSWDMGNDRSGMPHGYHFAALTDAITMGPEHALKMRTGEKERYGLDHPDTNRHIADLERMQGKQVTKHDETRPVEAGHYFTPDETYSFIANSPSVYPVYLSIKNPVYVNSSVIETAGSDFVMEKYRAQGYDGAIFAEDKDNLAKRGWSGATQIVAFDSHQIKSAIGNNGAFSPHDPDITKGAISPTSYDTPRDPGYAYHTTHADNVPGIAASGLKPRTPSHSGEQQFWPKAMGGSGREGRVYLAPTPKDTEKFSEHGHVLLRVHKSGLVGHDVHEEIKGRDYFTRKKIAPKHIEVHDPQTGNWHPVGVDEMNKGIGRLAFVLRKGIDGEPDPKRMAADPDAGKFTDGAFSLLKSEHKDAYTTRKGQLHVEPVGHVRDFLQGKKVRALYKDALDTPVHVTTGHLGAGTQAAYDHNSHAIHFNGDIHPGTVDHRNLLLHEAAHAIRGAKNRLSPAIESSQRDEYLASQNERSARRMANYARLGVDEMNKSVSPAPATAPSQHPFLGVVLPGGHVSDYHAPVSRTEAPSHSLHYQDAGLTGFDNDKSLRFVKNMSRGHYELEGHPALHPDEKASHQQIRALAKHLHENGVPHTTHLVCADHGYSRSQYPHQGHSLGTVGEYAGLGINKGIRRGIGRIGFVLSAILMKHVKVGTIKPGDPHPTKPHLAPSDAATRDIVKQRGHSPVPPSSWGLHVSPDPDADVQATYYDAAGRKQSKYHTDHEKRASDHKYAALHSFHAALPHIRAQVRADLQKPDAHPDRVRAAVVHLMDHTAIRVGAEKYAKENGTFGASSLRKQHVSVSDESSGTHDVKVNFTGKKGKEAEKSVHDAPFHAAVSHLMQQPGDRLFQQRKKDGGLAPVTEKHVNDYLGKFGAHAHQFRTYHGTRIAATHLLEQPHTDDPKVRAQHVTNAMNVVSEHLGNTPEMARKAYVSPEVVHHYMAGTLKPEHAMPVTELS